MDFKKLLAAVLGTLGITEMSKGTDGKMTLTAEQKTALTDRWGAKFVEEFSAELAKHEEEGGISATDLAAELATLKADNEKNTTELTTLRAQLAAADKAKQDADAIIAAMGKTAVEGEGQVVTGANTGNVRKAFKADANMVHNQAIAALAAGRSYTGDTTVDTIQLQSEFGRYVSNEKMEIFRSLVGTTSSLEYMTTMITDKFEVKATHAHISSVLQSFVPHWTPKGKTTFTPLVIKQYPMKINVSIIPSDVIDEVLGYLYDENLDPAEMPIVKYIIEMLVKPILDEERETAFAIGEYKEPSQNSDGKWIANEANQVCEGYLTQLQKIKAAGNKEGVNFLLDGKELGDGETLLKNIENAVDEIKPNYKSKEMYIHADPDIILKYSRAYRNKYPNTKNDDGEKVKVDYTKFTFVPLEGMRGTGSFFITPKTNFRHIMSRNPQDSKLRMATQDYEAKIYGEWREGVGFWLAEAIFAYLKPAAAPIPPKTGI